MCTKRARQFASTAGSPLEMIKLLCSMTRYFRNGILLVDPVGLLTFAQRNRNVMDNSNSVEYATNKLNDL